MKPATRAVHAGDRKAPAEFTPATTPIHNATSYFYSRMEDIEKVFAGEVPGQGYARYGNPTNEALEELVAALEGADTACAAASGMAALYVALSAAMTDRRKSIVAGNALFGETFRMLGEILEPMGVEITYADPCDFDAFQAAIERCAPGCVFVESISNPLARVAPLDRIVEAAHARDAVVVVDATFNTPVLLRPLDLGADLVVHSASKFLAGHGDVLGGVVAAGEPWRETLLALTRNLGSNLGPFEAYMTMRGIKTLPLRMERHCRNALRVAEALAAHPRVEKVHYPGLGTHPDHETERRLFSSASTPMLDSSPMFGGVLSFALRDAGREEVLDFLNRLQMIIRGTSLGDVHSLIAYPMISSHRNLAPNHRRWLGIGDNLVRLSVGIEAAEDIIADLDQALNRTDR